MFSRGLALSALCLGLGFASHAQIESESLDDISAWGQRFLPAGEPEFPNDLWRGSSDETLLALMQSIRVDALGPAEKRLLRRIVLSPATRPEGENAETLLAERARLMLELGEADAAAAIAPQLEADARGLDPETFAVDLDLASGQEASACAVLNDPLSDAEYWYKLRAVCAVLQDNFSGAELAIEIGEAQGVDDDWMIEAIFAAAGDVPNPPNARFDTGLNIALSSKANLDMSDITLAEGRPDLAAAAARRPSIPAELRVRFTEIASEYDLISVDERREILLDRFAQEEAATFSALEVALGDLRDPFISDAQRFGQLADVLRSAAAADAAYYQATAELFLPDLQNLLGAPVSASSAIEYARAAMMAGDPETSLSWLRTFNFEGAGSADPYETAVLQAVAVMVDTSPSKRALITIQDQLIDQVDRSSREQQVASILSAWAGLGLPLSARGRDFLAQQSDRGERMAQGQLLGLRGALSAEAIAEAGLLVLVTLRGEQSRLARVDVAELISSLKAIGADDVARELAIESTEFWEVPT